MEISKTKSIADLIKASLISGHVQSLVLDSFKRASVRYPYLQASISQEHGVTFEEQKTSFTSMNDFFFHRPIWHGINEHLYNDS